MSFEKSWPEHTLTGGQPAFTNTSVVIVGAGIGGMCVALDMIRRNQCRDFVILERATGVGGTWHANTYPGCAVDLQAIVYSYSFAPNSHWSRDFPGQPEILAYLTRVAQEYGLYEHIRFGSTAESAVWDEAQQKWHTRVVVAPGSKDAETTSEYTLASDFLVSAVGQLSQPQWPNIPGLDTTFAGKVMHSAAWDWTCDVHNKKIAVVGSGCSAVQIVPELAKVAAQVTVFQRTPHWIVPRGDYEIPALRKALYRWFPRWQRFWRRRYVDQNETEYFSNNFADHPEHQKLEQEARDLIRAQLPDRPDLWAKVTPSYPLGGKRVVVSDFFLPALGRANVALETRPIHSVTERTVRVVGAEGAEDIDTDFDLIVCATGFRATDFLHPLKIYGREGRALHEMWRDGAQAYQGTTAPDMPNFAMVLGPNTSLLHNSFILMIEAQSRYIVDGLIQPVLEERARGGALSLAPRQDATDRYNARIQERLKEFAASRADCASWYKTAAGRITTLWPGLVIEFQKLLEYVHYADYEVAGAGQSAVRPPPSRHVGRVREEGGVLERLPISTVVMAAVGASALVGGVLTRRVMVW